MSYSWLIAGSNGSISLAWTPIAPAGNNLAAIQTAPLLPGTGPLGGEMTSGTVNGSFGTNDKVWKFATFFLQDDGSIPSNATIIDVQIYSRIRGFNTGQPAITGMSFSGMVILGNGGNTDYVVTVAQALGVYDGWYVQNAGGGVSATYANTWNPNDTSGFSANGSVNSVNPLTGAAWTRAQLFSTQFGVGGSWFSTLSPWSASDKGVIFDMFLVQVQWTAPPPSLTLVGSGGLLIGGSAGDSDGGIVLANLNVDGSGGLEIGGSALLVLSVDSSGIYTLVKDKTHDTLYERVAGITSVDVKIPDPTAKTGYLGG